MVAMEKDENVGYMIYIWIFLLQGANLFITSKLNVKQCTLVI